jgi:hypothetical protein
MAHDHVPNIKLQHQPGEYKLLPGVSRLVPQHALIATLSIRERLGRTNVLKDDSLPLAYPYSLKFEV